MKCAQRKYDAKICLLQSKPVANAVTVFSIGFEVDVESWEVDVTEAKCQ